MADIRSQHFVYEGELPGLNEIIAAQGTGFRVGNRRVSKYTEWKKRYTETIILQLRLQRIDPVQYYPVRFNFIIYVGDMRKDPDNIKAGVMKMMHDGFKAGGIIANDGWAQLVGEDGTTGDAPILRVDAKRPRVVVNIQETVP